MHDERFTQIEQKLDRIYGEIVALHVQKNDIVWIKRIAKFGVTLIVSYCTWATLSIMELETNVTKILHPQRDKSNGYYEESHKQK